MRRKILLFLDCYGRKDVFPVCLAILELFDSVDIDHLDLNDCAKDERFKNRRIMTDGDGITEYFEKDDDSYEWKFHTASMGTLETVRLLHFIKDGCSACCES